MSDEKRSDRTPRENEPSETDSELTDINPGLENDPELNMILKQWRSPEPPSELQPQVLSAYRQQIRKPTLLAGWRKVIANKLPIPLPLAASLLIMALLAPIILRINGYLDREPLTIETPKLPTIPSPPPLTQTDRNDPGSKSTSGQNGEGLPVKPGNPPINTTPKPAPTTSQSTDRGATSKPEGGEPDKSNKTTPKPAPVLPAGILVADKAKVERDGKELRELFAQSDTLKGDFIWFILAEGQFIVTRQPENRFSDYTKGGTRLLEGSRRGNIIEFDLQRHHYRLISQSNFVKTDKQPDDEEEPITIFYLPANLPLDLTYLLGNIPKTTLQQLQIELGVTDQTALAAKLQKEFLADGYLSGATNELNELLPKK